MPQQDSHPALSKDARKAISEVLEAISTWHTEMADASTQNNEKVIAKMSAAAQALGWPREVVDAFGAQMQSINKMQLELIHHITDAWEEQIKSPNPMAKIPTAMMSKLQSWPSSTQHLWPAPDAHNQWSSNPMDIWMQMGEQWQKNWAQAMTYWANAGRPR